MQNYYKYYLQNELSFVCVFMIQIATLCSETHRRRVTQSSTALMDLSILPVSPGRRLVTYGVRVIRGVARLFGARGQDINMALP